VSKVDLKSNGGAPSERTRVKRYNWLAAYDRPSVEAILDAVPTCHVAYVFDGAPYVTPTLQWREDDRVYWHGSSASRFLRASVQQDVCLTVSIVDGFVLARSAYNLNVNHRSVMILGRPEKVTDTDAKVAHLRTFVDRFVPGHWERLRPPTEQELKATTLLSMPINEASTKIRVGMPEDEPGDYDHPVWAGIVPMRTVCEPPVADPRNLPGVTMPPEVLDFRFFRD
jgi:nitroimidazol reductase NimA-like FMN-containing flavoprotein (pyridoxamine 5'-phosphate oxidase superfamily)